jgi:Kef-type K+ transport system membrane component KefB
VTPAAITLTSPTGSAWEFLLLFAVVIIGPPIIRRARIPGLIGLLAGGFAIGPHGLNLLTVGSTTIPDLGQLGLLYLMFVAGIEIDLVLLRRHLHSAVVFAALTFSFPMLIGTGVGQALGWSVSASLLLGSLLASHTLVLYPLVAHAGLGKDPMIASAVGATVLTDTVTLVILAVIAGTTAGTGSTGQIILTLAIGLLVLVVGCFVILPFVAQRAFRVFGGDRTVRYVIAVEAFLIAAVVAETFGIEGIVGAFFAGLALNRLVPNEGRLMDRIDFFGSAVFVPVFLVSVGLLLNPSVMIQPGTLGLAALFILSSTGGKLIGASLSRPLLGATGPESWLMWALTTPQAAATLAATTVGFEIGLFDETVVNAVLVLILVSVIVSTVVAERAVDRVELPAETIPALGERVLVAVADLDGASVAMRIARALAAAHSGVIEIVLLEPAGSAGPRRRANLDRLDGLCHRLGIDTEPVLRVTDHRPRSTMLAASDFVASMVIAVGLAADEWAETAGLHERAAVALVEGTLDRPLATTDCVSIPPSSDEAGAVLSELVAVMPTSVNISDTDGAGLIGRLSPGQLGFATLPGWDDLSSARAPSGAALLVVAEALLPQIGDGRSQGSVRDAEPYPDPSASSSGSLAIDG